MSITKVQEMAYYTHLLQNESSYFTALSEYLITCMIFVLFAMMYFGVMALVVHIKLARMASKKKSQLRDQVVSTSISIEISHQDANVQENNNDKFEQELYRKWDHRIFLTYNLIFVIYNILYFSLHMS